MARRKAVDDDDGDNLDDVPPPGYVAPPEPHERSEYARRLQKLLDAIEIPELDRDARLYLQRMLRRYDCLRSLDKKRFPTKGEEEVTILLRTVFESNNGASALTPPILRAVSGCMRQEWTGKGLKFIEAFDHVDLVGLHGTLCDLGLEDQLDRALQRKLRKIFDSDEVPKPVAFTLGLSKHTIHEAAPEAPLPVSRIGDAWLVASGSSTPPIQHQASARSRSTLSQGNRRIP